VPASEAFNLFPGSFTELLHKPAFIAIGLNPEQLLLYLQFADHLTN
jgi:hypothetical protein